MLTLEDKIIAEEGEVPATAPCETCLVQTAPFALVAEDEEGPFICGHCLTDQHRAQVAADELAAQQEEVIAPWETEFGKAVKAERNRRIDSVAWAVIPLTSPLSSACQAAFVTYIQTLHRLTIDFTNPEEVTWPEQPALAYPEPEE